MANKKNWLQLLAYVTGSINQELLLRNEYQELRGLTTGLDSYRWSTGMVRSKPIPIPVLYLVGVPIETGSGITPNRSAVHEAGNTCSTQGV